MKIVLPHLLGEIWAYKTQICQFWPSTLNSLLTSDFVNTFFLTLKTNPNPLENLVRDDVFCFSKNAPFVSGILRYTP